MCRVVKGLKIDIISRKAKHSGISLIFGIKFLLKFYSFYDSFISNQTSWPDLSLQHFDYTPVIFLWGSKGFPNQYL
jgi:hypothetical protein